MVSPFLVVIVNDYEYRYNKISLCLPFPLSLSIIVTLTLPKNLGGIPQQSAGKCQPGVLMKPPEKSAIVCSNIIQPHSDHDTCAANILLATNTPHQQIYHIR